MKRVAFNFGVAVMAFAVGVGCELAFTRYLDATSSVPPVLPHSQLIDLAGPLPQEQVDVTAPPPGSLGIELERIDQIYRKRCQLPTDWYGDWPTVKQLATFRVCNDQWANARREAINTELSNYMVQY
jgi:hypothetical protein